jgi:hypothetical protein
MMRVYEMGVPRGFMQGSGKRIKSGNDFAFFK